MRYEYLVKTKNSPRESCYWGTLTEGTRFLGFGWGYKKDAHRWTNKQDALSFARGLRLPGSVYVVRQPA